MDPTYYVSSWIHHRYSTTPDPHELSTTLDSPWIQYHREPIVDPPHCGQCIQYFHESGTMMDPPWIRLTVYHHGSRTTVDPT